MSHLTRPRPPSPPWQPISNPRLFPDGSAWQLGRLGEPGSLSVLVLDIDARWQVSVVAPGRSLATDEQLDDVRVDFGLVACEEWPPLDGVRMLVTLTTLTTARIPMFSYTGPIEYKGQEVYRLDISATGWRDESIDFGDGATVVGLTSSGDEVPIAGPVIVLADLPDGVVALQWSGGGR